MSVKKFKATVSSSSEFEIEIDETIITPEYLKEWEKRYYPCDNVQDLAEYLAKAIHFNKTIDGFYEGFGFVKIVRRSDGAMLTKEKSVYAKGITVYIIGHQDNVNIEVEPIK